MMNHLKPWFVQVHCNQILKFLVFCCMSDRTAAQGILLPPVVNRRHFEWSSGICVIKTHLLLPPITTVGATSLGLKS